jgi:hypothetical protein
MTETLSLSDSDFDQMLCYYVNTTSYVQVVQIHSMTNRNCGCVSGAAADV